MLKKGDSVTLTEAEQRLATYVAKARQESNDAAGHTPAIPLKRDGVTNNLWGMGAELAFARLMNVYPDLSTHLRVGGADNRLLTGDTVDVKTTPYLDRPLLVVSIRKRPGDADIYALMLCDYPTYTFVGWATAEQVFASVKDLGYGPSYVLEPHELEPVIVTAADINWNFR